MFTIRVTILFILFHFEKKFNYFSFNNYKYGCVMCTNNFLVQCVKRNLEKFRLRSTNKLQSTNRLHLKKCPINTQSDLIF